MKLSAIFSLLLLTGQLIAQGPPALTLDECQSLARENYPLIKNANLIQQTGDFNASNASTGYAPRISINGQATYQSDVTGLPDLPIPIDLTPLAKDQYRIYGEVSQPLTGLFTNGRYVDIQNAQSKAELEQLEVDIYALTERINQIYFGILLIDAQIEQTKTVISDLQRTLNKTKASIAAGTALRMQGDVLQSEILKLNQKITELEVSKTAYMNVLGAFIGRNLDLTTSFETPRPLTLREEYNRPELRLFEARKQINEIRNKQITDANIPQFFLFVQGGYGRPGLNMLSNEFELYYVAGLKMTWNISNFYTSGKTKEITTITSQQIDIQQETFLFNLKLSSIQQRAEMDKWSQLLLSDDELIGLKTGIAETAKHQLEEGVITSNDYLSYVNAEDQARQNKIAHHIQWLLAQYNQQYIIGK